MKLPSVAVAMSVRPAMPTPSASVSDLDGVARMVGGLGNRLTIGWSGRCAPNPDQAHARCHDYRKHQMTHVNSSCFPPRWKLPSNFRGVKAAVTSRLRIAPKNDAQIIGRHRHRLRERKAVTRGQSRHVGEVAHAPRRVLRSQPGVEVLVARCGVTAVDPVRTVEINDTAGSQDASG